MIQFISYQTFEFNRHFPNQRSCFLQEEKVEESETETLEEKEKNSETRESSNRGRPRLGSSEESRKRKIQRKKKEEKDEQQKEESERSSSVDKKIEGSKDEDDVIVKKDDDSEPHIESKVKEYPGSDIPGRETDEETKEEVLVGRSITSTDSIPNSPASASARCAFGLVFC